MALRFYNTLTRQLDTFEPLEEGRVRLYTCGPTVYHYAHIGNFRSYMFEDLLRRYLRFKGFRVTQVMNLTDVDDKTIRGARERGVSLNEYTQQYKDTFFEDLKTLNIEPAEHYPAATDHVPEMIALIERLMEKGVAYRSDDGSVYFSIAKFPAYGRLAHLDLSGLRAGARVAQDEYEKDNVADFALWKAWDENDGEVAWDSPWGRGRPGWHIECSAMSMKYLGESFDIHTGGVDNMFPHHEDEIAQSEAATGKPFVKYWLHCAHLIVDGRKMSKSLGNFFTLRDVIGRGFSGREVRYVLMATHYRQWLNFTFDTLRAARAALDRLDEFRARLEKTSAGAAAGPAPAWADEALDRFAAAMDEDLNISGALGALFDMIHAGNKALDGGTVDAPTAGGALATLRALDRVLGLLQETGETADAAARELAALRLKAREAKNWPEADRLRKELLALGWLVKDTPQGPELKKA
ncbi:MAG TPA: cysteine--tRNA ligase [Kiritimatiellia bacterium]|nr:cysteine--tRNA ligase [Kiritimatiellia bacterium]HRZ11931.1 cysteine--tRNA ligase [Kiritimatiellia bacterium]HSA17263.1 cysteine--tRNA ligase [Kiritimatiellia bacterium]